MPECVWGFDPGSLGQRGRDRTPTTRKASVERVALVSVAWTKIPQDGSLERKAHLSQIRRARLASIPKPCHFRSRQHMKLNLNMLCLAFPRRTRFRLYPECKDGDGRGQGHRLGRDWRASSLVSCHSMRGLQTMLGRQICVFHNHSVPRPIGIFESSHIEIGKF